MMAACILDMELLRATNGKSGIKELMQRLLRRHANTNGLTEDKLIAALTELGGGNFATLYEQLANDKASLDIPALLQKTGIRVRQIDDAKKTFDTYGSASPSLVDFAPAGAEEQQSLNWFMSTVR